MRYEPIKRSLGRLFRKSITLKKIFFFLLELLLLRSWHVRKALKKIGSSLPANAVVLDAGSGFGQYSWRMSSMFRKWMIEGIEINEDDIKECNEFIKKTGRSERVRFIRGDLANLSEKNRYDLIITIDVMEHIREDWKVFSNFAEALRIGGLLLISTPSDKGGSDVHNDDDASFIDEHVRDGYGKEEMITKLERAGFKEVKVLYTYGKAGTASWKLSMKYPVKMINVSYLFFIILPFWYLVTFPVSFVLNLIDVGSVNKSGTGLLVVAVKK